MFYLVGMSQTREAVPARMSVILPRLLRNLGTMEETINQSINQSINKLLKQLFRDSVNQLINIT